MLEVAGDTSEMGRTLIYTMHKQMREKEKRKGVCFWCVFLVYEGSE